MQPEPHIDVTFVPLPGAEFSPKNFSQVDRGEITFLPRRYQENFEKVTGGTSLSKGKLWGFCMAGYPFRLDGGAEWQRCRPSPLWEPGKRPISLAQIDAINEADTRATRNFFSHCKQVDLEFFVISLPSSLRDFHPSDNDSDKRTRAFLQNRSRMSFAAWLKENEIDYIEVPDGLQDEHGFMNPEFMRLVKPNGAKDFNHGNGKYGSLMMEKILNYVHARSPIAENRDA